MSHDAPSILLVTADADFAALILFELCPEGNGHGGLPASVAPTLAQARRNLELTTPAVIVLDESFSRETDIISLAREMLRHAPVVCAVSPAHQSRLAPLVSTGEVDCVVAVEDYFPLVKALVERQLRRAVAGLNWEESAAAEEAGDFVSMIRHELNNPLTGILGNAEMLLRQRARLSPEATVRVETIADLAVRLRETIRRISNAWEGRQRMRAGG